MRSKSGFSGKSNNHYVPVGGGKPAKILGVSGQCDASAELDRCGDDMGIGQVLRAGSGSSQDAADEPGQRAIRVAHLDPCLARQARINQRIVPRTTIELGQNHARDHDLSVEAHRRTQRSTNLQAPSPWPARQSR